MTAEEIETKVKSIIAEELTTDLSEVTDNADLVDDLGGDSLDLVELTMALEEEFGIELPETLDDVERNIKVSTIVAEVRKRMPHAT